MFTVRPVKLSEEAQRLERISGRLDMISQTLNRIQSELMNSLEVDSTDEIIEAIRKLDRQVMTEHELTGRFSKILENTAQNYRGCEKRIISEAEEVALLHRNVSAQHNDLSWYSDKLSGLNFR